MSKSTKYCAGCRDNFYNGQANFSCFGCWSLKDAKVVTRYRIGWWTAPTEPGAFVKVKTYDCHHAPGRYAHYEKLPACAAKAADRT